MRADARLCEIGFSLFLVSGSPNPESDELTQPNRLSLGEAIGFGARALKIFLIKGQSCAV